jgi:hypothetical protein
VSICRGFPFPQGTIAIHGSTDQIVKGALINFVTFVEINRSPFIASKAGVEELVRIWKACAGLLNRFHSSIISGSALSAAGH